VQSYYLSKGVGRKTFSGGNGKKDRKIAKKDRNSTIKPLPGRAKGKKTEK